MAGIIFFAGNGLNQQSKAMDAAFLFYLQNQIHLKEIVLLSILLQDFEGEWEVRVLRQLILLQIVAKIMIPGSTLSMY